MWESKPARFEAFVERAMLEQGERSGKQLGRGRIGIRGTLRRLEVL